MTIDKLENFLNPNIQGLIQALNKEFGIQILAVFDLKNQKLIALYSVKNFTVQDEQNRKTFYVKGKVLDLNQIIQKPNWQYTIKQDLENLPDYSITYSDNLFGFIGFGLIGY